MDYAVAKKVMGKNGHIVSGDIVEHCGHAYIVDQVFYMRGYPSRVALIGMEHKNNCPLAFCLEKIGTTN